jgi:ABC-type Fe3+/spermidine/putrescine transport system ATPase subunit
VSAAGIGAAPAVEVIGVHKRFGDHLALDGIDLAIAPGEFVSLLGPSGCGKTTLLRIVAGFEQPTRGMVRIHGTDVTHTPPERRPTNIVFQRGALFPHMTVAENIGYSLKLRHWPRGQIAARVDELLALVRLAGLGSRGPTQLSGGQIQRAALARALAPGPEVLLLDEPLSALDLKLRQQMQLELRAIHRQLAATFVYVTHDQTEAMVLSDRIAVMNHGRIVQVGSPREIYTRPASVFASDFIGDTNLIPGTVVELNGRSVQVAATGGRMIAGETADLIAAGDAVTVSVRPASVRVSAGDGADIVAARVGVLAAEIAEIIYLGDRVRVDAVVDGAWRISADLRDEEARGLAPGMPVRLTWEPAAATVWGAEPVTARAATEGV